MRYFGDIPEEHLELVEELLDLEAWFNDYGSEISPEMAAKGMVSISHDYYLMDFDEEGDRIIRRAEKLSPGYFKNTIHKHAEKDSQYEKLVRNLTKSLGIDLMKSYGFKP